MGREVCAFWLLVQTIPGWWNEYYVPSWKKEKTRPVWRWLGRWCSFFQNSGLKLARILFGFFGDACFIRRIPSAAFEPQVHCWMPFSGSWILNMTLDVLLATRCLKGEGFRWQTFGGHDFDMNEGGNPLKFVWLYMGVSKNRDTPKMDGFIMETPIKMDDLGVPLFSETSIYKENGFFQCFQIQEVVNYSWWKSAETWKTRLKRGGGTPWIFFTAATS